MTPDALQTLWLRHRAEAGLDSAEEIGAAVLGAYAQAHRRYHGLSHLHFLFAEEQAHHSVITDHALVRFAIWFHDAIYDPQRSDNEANSAIWAESALAGRPDLAAAVSRLILKTKNHAVGEATADESLFLDMDIAILGAPRPAYLTYAAGVRAEYAFAPDEAYRRGRAAFLQAQLDLPRLFRTAIYHARLNTCARDNMAFEAGLLAAGQLPG